MNQNNPKPEGSHTPAGIPEPMNTAPYTEPPYQPVDPYVGQAPYQQPVNPYAGQPQYRPPAGSNFVQPPQAARPSAAPVRTPLRSGKPRDVVMAVIVVITSFIMVDCLFWVKPLGIGFAAAGTIFLTAAVWYLIPVKRHVSFYTVAGTLLLFAGSVSPVFSGDSGSKAITLFCMTILYFCMLMDVMDIRVWTPGTFRSIGDFFYTVFGTSFGRIGAGMYGLFHRDKKDGHNSKAGVGKALLGLLIALPFAAILIALLTSGDEAFRGMIEGIDLGDWSGLPKRIAALMISIPLAILLFSQLFSLRDIRRERREEGRGVFDPTILTFFLLGIGAVYIAYLFSQLAYFFSGFGGFLPEEFTYAEYARRGFFELTAVSVINILIVILVSALCKKKQGRLPLGVKLLSLFLCLFSLVLAGTEIAKMKMYTDAYGLTRLRILTTLFMVFLAIVFLALIVQLFFRRFPYLKVAVLFGALIAVTVSFVSVDRMVADYNVWAYQSGVLETVDVDTITELGDAAVPALLELAQDGDEQAADEAKAELCRRRNSLYQNGAWDYYMNRRTSDKPAPFDWRGFNTVSYRARQLLLENEAVYLSSDDKTV